MDIRSKLASVYAIAAGLGSIGKNRVFYSLDDLKSRPGSSKLSSNRFTHKCDSLKKTKIKKKQARKSRKINRRKMK